MEGEIEKTGAEQEPKVVTPDPPTGGAAELKEKPPAEVKTAAELAAGGAAPGAAKTEAVATATVSTAKPAAKPPVAEKPKALKIVITYSNMRAQVGLERTDCDPVFFTAEGDLQTVLAKIPDYVKEAREKWKSFQRYPKSALVPVVTKPAVTNSKTTATRPAAPAKTNPEKPTMI